MKTIPEPFKIDASQLDVRSLQAEGRKFRQFSRITASLTDSGHVHNLSKNADVRKFDLIAVRPSCEQILASVATRTDVDLICFDASQQLPWLYKGQLLQLAVERGIGSSRSATLLHSLTVRREQTSSVRQSRLGQKAMQCL